ncbi:MAG: ATP-dependent sacrificial sulfur transferase LarE [Bryobacteraceae bacterium]|nr:ATP-dependent sacrificial sulfur transferase LarE [Bryobacteraceae bacterium]
MTGLVSLGRNAAQDVRVLREKQDRLFRILRSLGRVLVAYSGGTDSAYLAWAAREVLGDNAIAVTADSPSIPESHKREAADFARRYGIRHEFIPSHEFDNPAYVANNPDRCYHCKDELFRRMEQIAPRYGGAVLVYGVNTDDLGDYRPGQNAAKLHGVKAPLVEAGLSKAEIRELSRMAGLPTWDRPAAACLSSRVPYGTPVTPEVLKRIELAEEQIRALGFRQFRVRYHNEVARLEIDRSEMERALSLEMFDRFEEIFRGLGFLYSALDLRGYRQGALNEALGARTAPADPENRPS